MSEIANANTSAAVMAHQMPSMSNSTGRTRTQQVWKSSVRRKEIAAETKPLLSAVKKAEVKMLKPESRKEKENRRNACSVSACSVSS